MFFCLFTIKAVILVTMSFIMVAPHTHDAQSGLWMVLVTCNDGMGSCVGTCFLPFWASKWVSDLVGPGTHGGGQAVAAPVWVGPESGCQDTVFFTSDT